MKLEKPFSEKTRKMFFEEGKSTPCFVCMLGNADSLHHILGRESDSPFNACPIHNNGCHFERAGMLSKIKGKLLNRTFHFLENIGYVLKEDDIKFIEKYKKDFGLLS